LHLNCKLNLYREIKSTHTDLEVRQTTVRKTKLKATFALLHRCSTYLKTSSD